MIVKPETVTRWHRRGFRLYWKYISTHGKNKGKPKTAREIRVLIRKMAKDNPTWRAPRIHGELLKLDLRFRSGLFLAIFPGENRMAIKSKNGWRF